MCGRYATTRSAPDLSELFGATDETAGGLASDYNVAPTDPVPIVRRSRRVAGPVLTVARWGLVPSWASDTRGAARMINARAETVSTNASFKTAMRRRRCIIPADGFYEWQRLGGEGKKPRKQPFFIRRRDGKPMALAGLWEVWKPRDDPDADWLRSTTIITGEPNELVARLHDRMPVILPEDTWDTWLDRDNEDVESLMGLLVPYPVDLLEAYPVDTLVNSVQNDGPELIEPLEGHDPLD
jgi:putative SOS response-associated peptidase YedK